MGLSLGDYMSRASAAATGGSKKQKKDKQPYVSTDAFDFDETTFDVEAMAAFPWVVAYLGEVGENGRRTVALAQLGSPEASRGSLPVIVIDAGPDAPLDGIVQRSGDYARPLTVTCADIMSLMGGANEAGRLVLDESSALTPLVTRVSVY